MLWHPHKKKLLPQAFTTERFELCIKNRAEVTALRCSDRNKPAVFLIKYQKPFGVPHTAPHSPAQPGPARLTRHPGQDVTRRPPAPCRAAARRVLLGARVHHQAAEALDALGIRGRRTAAGGAPGGRTAADGGTPAAARAEQAALEALVLGEVVETGRGGEGERGVGGVQRQQRVEAARAHVQAAGAGGALGPGPPAGVPLLRAARSPLVLLHAGLRAAAPPVDRGRCRAARRAPRGAGTERGGAAHGAAHGRASRSRAVRGCWPSAPLRQSVTPPCSRSVGRCCSEPVHEASSTIFLSVH